jgi:hypothetical protein
MLTISATIDRAALQRVLDALEELGGPPNDLQRMIGEAMAQDSVLKRTANYPDNRRAPQPFKSAQQRRFFFAALKSGAISVPYQRTYALQRGWTYVPGGGGGVVTNRTPYAAMVMGSKGEQSGYFAGKGWLSVDKIAQEAEAQDAPWVAQAAVTLWIGKRGIG